MQAARLCGLLARLLPRLDSLYLFKFSQVRDRQPRGPARYCAALCLTGSAAGGIDCVSLCCSVK